MRRSEFIKVFTGITPYRWQEEVADDLIPINSKVTLRCCNEAGKTKMLLAPNAAYDLTMFKKATVLVSSAVYRQLIDQVLPSVKEFGLKMNWQINVDRIKTKSGGLLRAIASDEGGYYEGYHRGADDIDAPLSIYLDEAKSIPQGIFDAVERCRPTRLLIDSSPGAPVGGFYRACRDERFKHYIVTAYDCPHIPAERISEMAKMRGVSDPLYKSMIMADWMADSCDLYAVPALALQALMESKPLYVKGKRIATIDVARAETGDENVICVRDGNRFDLARTFHGGGDTIRCVDRFIGEFKKLDLKPQDVWIDYDGIGASFWDVFVRKGWGINQWSGCAAARQKSRYKNAKAEAWLGFGAAIENHSIIVPPDSILYTQLSEAMYFITDEGKIAMMDKSQTRDGATTYGSPDRADAFVMAHHLSPVTQSAAFDPMGKGDSFNNFSPGLKQLLQGVSPNEELHSGLPPGFNCGN
jgi:hypothetical protein